MSEHWWSIEVLDGAFPASVWYDAHGNALVEAAVTNGALDWSQHRHPWGLVFEISFRDHDQWFAFRHLPAVSAALDAVPDPINGLLIYPGRGGSSGAGDRRRPRLPVGAGAATLPRQQEPRLVAGRASAGYAEPLTVVE
jgi:hypothetical protein